MSKSTKLSTGSNNPLIIELRHLHHEDPSGLRDHLLKIGRQEPDLLAAINNNRPEFLQLMKQQKPLTTPTKDQGAKPGKSAPPGTGTRTSKRVRAKATEPGFEYQPVVVKSRKKAQASVQ